MGVPTANGSYHLALPLVSKRPGAPAQTGRYQMVQVHYIEGVAIHNGPESCGYDREVMREALTGGSAGQPLSCENSNFWVPTFSGLAEGNTDRRANRERLFRPNVVLDPGMHG